MLWGSFGAKLERLPFVSPSFSFCQNPRQSWPESDRRHSWERRNPISEGT